MAVDDLEALALELGLPISVAGLQEASPLEDVILAVVREKFPDVSVYTKIPFDQTPDQIVERVKGGMFVLVRRIASAGMWRGRPGLLDAGMVAIHVYTRDPDGELKGSLVSEAVLQALHNAARDNWYQRGVGRLVKVDVMEAPNRKTDWATASGPVQFADLPTGFWRFETRYAVTVRPPSVWS